MPQWTEKPPVFNLKSRFTPRRSCQIRWSRLFSSSSLLSMTSQPAQGYVTSASGVLPVGPVFSGGNSIVAGLYENWISSIQVAMVKPSIRAFPYGFERSNWKSESFSQGSFCFRSFYSEKQIKGTLLRAGRALKFWTNIELLEIDPYDPGWNWYCCS